MPTFTENQTAHDLVGAYAHIKGHEQALEDHRKFDHAAHEAHLVAGVEHYKAEAARLEAVLPPLVVRALKFGAYVDAAFEMKEEHFPDPPVP